MRNSENTRQLIIEKALPIFNTKGYHATSLSDITHATGITKGAIYGNFKNKDEVATAAFERATQIVLNQVSDRIRKEPDAPKKLKGMVEYYSDYIKNPPIEGGCPILNTSVEADDNLPHLRSMVIRTIALIKDSLVKIINRGMLEGQIKKELDAESFAITFYATIEGAVSLSRIEGDMRSYLAIQAYLFKMIDSISN